MRKNKNKYEKTNTLLELHQSFFYYLNENQYRLLLNKYKDSSDKRFVLFATKKKGSSTVYIIYVDNNDNDECCMFLNSLIKEGWFNNNFDDEIFELFTIFVKSLWNIYINQSNV